MTRFAATENETASGRPHVPYVLFAEFDFSSGFVRLNSSNRSMTHESNTYLGGGRLVGIGAVRENGNLNPEKLDFQLSGVDNSYITTVLTEDYHGRDARLWVGYLNADTFELVATPQILWEGFMDVLTIRTEAGGSTISLTCENRLILWNKSAGWLYTDEHQKLFDANDDFLLLVPTIANKEVRWGGGTVDVGGAIIPGVSGNVAM